jgi:hypothetical protein
MLYQSIFFNIFQIILARILEKGQALASQTHESQKLVPRSKTRILKIPNNQEHLIQESCNQIERGKVTIIDISKDLPETLSNWDLFVRGYNSQVGTVVKFVKIDAHRWSILKETERETWTVGKWTKVSITRQIIKYIYSNIYIY